MKIQIFGASWCHSCHALEASMQGQHFPGYEIEFLDMEKHHQAANRWGVRGLPTIVIPDKDIVKSGITTVTQFTRWLAGVK